MDSGQSGSSHFHPFLRTLSPQPYRQFPNSPPYLPFNQYPMAHTTKRRGSTPACRIRPSPSRIRHSSSYKPITFPRHLSYQCAICNRKWYGFAQPKVPSSVLQIFLWLSMKVVRKVCRIVELTLYLYHRTALYNST